MTATGALNSESSRCSELSQVLGLLTKKDEHVTFHFLFILRWIIDQFYKEKLEDGKIVRVTAEFTFKSKNTVVLNERQVKQALKEQQEYILGKIEAFINMESDWHIDKILASFINIARYTCSAARGTSQIKTGFY